MKQGMTPEARLNCLYNAVELLLTRAMRDADPTERSILETQIKLVRGLPYAE